MSPFEDSAVSERHVSKRLKGNKIAPPTSGDMRGAKLLRLLRLRSFFGFGLGGVLVDESI